MKLSYFAIAAAFAVFANCANAAPACQDTGVANGYYLTFDPKDDAAVYGLKIGIVYGLTPLSFPAQEITAHSNACQRGAFNANGATFQTFGEDADAPPRWAVSATDPRIIYFARLADPLEAFAAAQKPGGIGPDLKTEKPLYALTIADGALRTIYLLRETLPSDYQLADEMRAALDGKMPVLATFDVRTYKIELVDLTSTRIVSNGDLPTGLLTFKTPDGVYFAADKNGGAHHAPSGLACPARIGAFERGDMQVLKPAQGGLDIQCRYFAEKSWVSIFDTKLSGMSMDAVFAAYLQDAQSGAPPIGELAAPGEVHAALPMKSAFWKGAEGALQAMWLLQDGDWFIEIRATYAAGEEANVATLAQAFLDRQK